MNRLRYYLSDSRTIALIVVAVAAGLLFAGRNTLKLVAFWSGVGLLAVLVVVLGLWVVRRLQARRAGAELGAAMLTPDEEKEKAHRAEVEVLRGRLRDAVKAIKTSRLGLARGTEALYELPWYMVIGNPAAGKSTAVVNSGLSFPFADQHGSIVQGIGGTRNCDWYFTTEGILLDTAGRYAVHDENRSEWLSFLELLRKHRPRAPINGIIIAVGIDELTGNTPEHLIQLAKSLRQRVQELTEWLEVIAPVYVIFTKADLIAGFNDFFRTLEDGERERAWGTTFPFQADGPSAGAEAFERSFDELATGLKEMSLAQMALHRGNAPAPGLLTLPLEFSGLKPVLRTFITTLFEDNPFQFRPVFRGFYFTSALQEAASVHHASDRIAQRFGLGAPAAADGEGAGSIKGYFLLDLFRKVIFADRRLVRQHSSRSRMRTRYAVLFGAALALGLALGGWAWSWTNNRQLVANVAADLDKVVAVQQDRIDLGSRLEALSILQDRLQQLAGYRRDHPLLLGLGLYQGGHIEERLRAEYFHGMQQLMLVPATRNLEAYLAQVVASRGELAAAEGGEAAPRRAAPGTYLAPSPTNAQDAYNALKAYLMLSHPERVEPVHLADQLTRFWREWLDANRGMLSRDELIGSADRLMTFYVAQYDQPGWAATEPKIALVDDTRQGLREVMHGLPAINRVYAEITARAATRYPAQSVAAILGAKDGQLLAGSHAVPGAFTREAWEGYVREAIRDAANKELNATDWVLETTRQTDLTLSGSPEQIQKQLEALYDKDFIAEWRAFLTGVSVSAFDSFPAAVAGMNTLGDPRNSPLRKLLDTVYRETSWDNPSLLDQGLESAQGGLTGWFKRTILRQQPRGVEINLDKLKGPDGRLRTGPVGSAFVGITRLVVARDGAAPLLDDYLGMLARLRTRLNAITNQGDAGPGARTLMTATFAGSDSELAAGLALVDERMLDGLEDDQRAALRPLLLRPLMQTFHALVAPAETEINRIWTAQVFDPFDRTLARKYPFDAGGQIQASDAEIGQVFGPAGAIAKFASDTLGPLVDRRGDTLTARQWADMGITLSPRLMADFAQWVAPLGQTAGSDTQTVFKLQPGPATGGISEYTIEINGQTLRYRNTPPTWQPFVWDSSAPNPVARISALTFDGRTEVIQEFIGDKALGQLIQAAQYTNNGDGTFTLAWNRNGIDVSMRLKIVSSPQANADGSRREGLAGTALPAAVAGAEPAGPALPPTRKESAP